MKTGANRRARRTTDSTVRALGYMLSRAMHTESPKTLRLRRDSLGRLFGDSMGRNWVGHQMVCGTRGLTMSQFRAEIMVLLEEFEPWVYHSAQTGSQYIKFRGSPGTEDGLGSLRIADHRGISKYRYRWNIMIGERTYIRRVVSDSTHPMRFYSDLDEGTHQLAQDMQEFANDLAGGWLKGQKRWAKKDR